MSHIGNFNGYAVREYVYNGVTYTNTTRYHSDLADEPSLTTDQLKSEWDRAAFETQRYINDILVPKVNELDDSQQSGVQVGGVQPYHLNSATNNAIINTATNVANDKVAEEVIRADAAYVAKGRNNNAAEILADGSINSVLLEDYGVPRNKIANTVIDSILIEPCPADRIFNSRNDYNNSTFRSTNVVCYVKVG